MKNDPIKLQLSESRNSILVIDQNNRIRSLSLIKDQEENSEAKLVDIINQFNSIDFDHQLNIEKIMAEYKLKLEKFEIEKENMIKYLQEVQLKNNDNNLILKFNKFISFQKSFQQFFDDNINNFFNADLKTKFLNIVFYLDDQIIALNKQNSELQKKLLFSEEMGISGEKQQLLEKEFNKLRKIIKKKEKVIINYRKQLNNSKNFHQIENLKNLKIHLEFMDIIKFLGKNLNEELVKKSIENVKKNEECQISDYSKSNNGYKLKNYIAMLKEKTQVINYFENKIKSIDKSIAKSAALVGDSKVEDYIFEDSEKIYIENLQDKKEDFIKKKNEVSKILEEGKEELKLMLKKNKENLKFCGIVRRTELFNYSSEQTIKNFLEEIRTNYKIEIKDNKVAKIIQKNLKLCNSNSLLTKFLQIKKKKKKPESTTDLKSLIEESDKQKKIINDLIVQKDEIMKEMKESEEAMINIQKDMKKNEEERKNVDFDIDLSKNKIRNLSVEMDVHKLEIEKLEFELEENLKNTKMKEDEIEKLMQKIKLEKTRIKDLKKQKSQLRISLEKKEQELIKINEKNEKLIKGLEDMNKKNMEMKKKLQEQFETIEKLFEDSFQNFELMDELKQKEESFVAMFNDQRNIIYKKNKEIEFLKTLILKLEERVKNFMQETITKKKVVVSIDKKKEDEYIQKIKTLENTLEEFKSVMQNQNAKNFKNSNSILENSTFLDEDEDDFQNIFENLQKGEKKIDNYIDNFFEQSEDTIQSKKFFEDSSQQKFKLKGIDSKIKNIEQVFTNDLEKVENKLLDFKFNIVDLKDQFISQKNKYENLEKVKFGLELQVSDQIKIIDQLKKKLFEKKKSENKMTPSINNPSTKNFIIENKKKIKEIKPIK
jgi:exonuclease SbcC